jgi:hypothetical protein
MPHTCINIQKSQFQTQGAIMNSELLPKQTSIISFTLRTKTVFLGWQPRDAIQINRRFIERTRLHYLVQHYRAFKNATFRKRVVLPYSGKEAPGYVSKSFGNWQSPKKGECVSESIIWVRSRSLKHLSLHLSPVTLLIEIRRCTGSVETHSTEIVLNGNV